MSVNSFITLAPGTITCISWKSDHIVRGDSEGNLNIWDVRTRTSRHINTNRGQVFFFLDDGSIPGKCIGTKKSEFFAVAFFLKVWVGIHNFVRYNSGRGALYKTHQTFCNCFFYLRHPYLENVHDVE